MDDGGWILRESAFDPKRQHHAETIFTIGNGYLSTRGALEEGYPGDSRATFVHGVFDAAPIAFTELANFPDWLPLTIHLDGERLDLAHGTLESYQRALDLRQALLKRSVRWVSPGGHRAEASWERIASLADPHALLLRCRVRPMFSGWLEFRAGLDGRVDNEGLAHWEWIDQHEDRGAIALHVRTRRSGIKAALAMRLSVSAGVELERWFWDVDSSPTLVVRLEAVPGREVIVEKQVAIYTSRDLPAEGLEGSALHHVHRMPGWDRALEENQDAWRRQWETSDVVIEGDPEAQLAVRFNLYQLLIAAPRTDDRVSIGAKTLSGFGYRGHVFWDTEIFMLPYFTYTAPAIARNLLDYRYLRLAGARAKARANGYEGAQFPWESADTGEEVTPNWVPDFKDPTRLVRIWTGEIEIHISADIAYAVFQYWRATGDDAWFGARGAEIILDTAKFYASRAEWNESDGRYQYRDVIGPDEYHDHVDNNYYTNRLAQWNLEAALGVLDWLKGFAPEHAAQLSSELDLSEARLDKWRDVIEKMYRPAGADGLIEQFEGYFKRTDVDLATLEPRTLSAQVIFGIEGTNATQVIKQPDVLMLLYLLPDEVLDQTLRANYNYYTPRTDYTFGSSLGPSIGAIMAGKVDRMEEAYELFMRGVRADLHDVRGNARDGIHGASAGGIWQAVVFGFGGLRVTPEGWTVDPRLPHPWSRLAFRFYHRGRLVDVDLKPEKSALRE